MKGLINLFLVALLAFLVSACSTSQLTLSSGADDIYWNKSTAVQGRAIVPDATINGAPSLVNGNETNNNNGYQSQEELSRAQQAYDSWNKQQANSSGVTVNSNTEQTQQTNNTYSNQVYEDNRVLGSNRNQFYNDPYYNALSNNWGWTSFYNPVIRPGFYQWAPGWNIGLGWNSWSGLNWGLSYGNWYPGWNSWGWNFGFNYGWGFNQWGNPWYSTWGGFYDPFWGPGWGFNNFYNPWNPWGWGNRFCCQNVGGDVVTNRPLLRPRVMDGSSGLPGRGLERPQNSIQTAQPASPNPATQSTRPQQNYQIQTQQAQPNRPSGETYSRPGQPYVNPTQQTTNRPGGELVNDRNGNPVYVRPSSPQQPSQQNINNRSEPTLRNPAPAQNPNYEQPAPRQNYEPRSRPDISPSPRGGGGFGGGNSGGGGSAPRSRPR